MKSLPLPCQAPGPSRVVCAKFTASWFAWGLRQERWGLVTERTILKLVRCLMTTQCSASGAVSNVKMSFSWYQIVPRAFVIFSWKFNYLSACLFGSMTDNFRCKSGSLVPILPWFPYKSQRHAHIVFSCRRIPANRLGFCFKCWKVNKTQI